MYRVRTRNLILSFASHMKPYPLLRIEFKAALNRGLLPRKGVGRDPCPEDSGPPGRYSLLLIPLTC